MVPHTECLLSETDELETIEANARALLAFVALKRRERQTCNGPRFYTGKTYPFGDRRFRRDIHAGMPAHREGKCWVALVADCEVWWRSRQRREPSALAVPTPDAERWARSGLRVVGTRGAR